MINLNAFVADNDADVIDGGVPGESIENITVNGQGGNDFLIGQGRRRHRWTRSARLPAAYPWRSPIRAPLGEPIVDEDVVPNITLNGGVGR